MSYTAPFGLELLGGASIASWVGVEEALDSGDGPDEPVVWTHPDILFSQFLFVDIVLDSGEVFRIDSCFDQEDGTPFGLMLHRPPAAAVPEAYFYRTIVMTGMPTGKCFVNIARRQGDAVIEAYLLLGPHIVRLLSGEVYRRAGGAFEIVEADELVLLQLNGRPLPSQ